MSASLYIVAENLPDRTGYSRKRTHSLEVRELMSFFSQDPDEASEFVEDDTVIPEE